MATAKQKGEKESVKQKSSPKEVKAKTKKVEKIEVNENDDNNADILADKSVENTLISLYKLQKTYSQIDKVRVVRGELPLEVSDLEDVCQGLQTRLDKFEDAIKEIEKEILTKKEEIKHSQTLIAKYKEQLNNVRNNREYDALSKEIEYEEIDIQVKEKKIKELTHSAETKRAEISDLENELNSRKEELKVKSGELNAIIAETEKDEKNLLDIAEEQSKSIEPRMLNAFTRIRSSMRNGLATVKIERNACGGCFNKISPQRQLDIQIHKKIIVCEFCGRILVDDKIAAMSEEN